jgi:hypothetical protein
LHDTSERLTVDFRDFSLTQSDFQRGKSVEADIFTVMSPR